MKIYLQQLKTELKKNIRPIYIISGDAPYLVQEACDQIITTCTEQGYQKETLYLQQQFDVEKLRADINTPSLFSDKKLIFIRAQGQKIPPTLSNLLSEISENPAPDTVIMLSTHKLAASTQNTKWFKAVMKNAIYVQIWPLDNSRFIDWIRDKLKTAGLNASQDAIHLLAERTEGNLLAAHQTVEQLKLIYTDGDQINRENMLVLLGETARYDVFKLVDAILLGEKKRSLQILSTLQAEAVEPTIILWALHRELKTLYEIQAAHTQGQSLIQAMAQQKVWDKRKPILRSMLDRTPLVKLSQFVKSIAELDQVVKGVQRGNPWRNLEQLCLAMSGSHNA